MTTKSVDIVTFDKQYADEFAAINFEWLDKYFYIEDYDREVLTNPQKYILDKGGEIIFALFNNKVVGTAALIKRGEGDFELSKMGVRPDYQGLKIGIKMIEYCIDYAKKVNAYRLFLDSSKKLTPAITLYHKMGFKEIPVPKDTPYERCDIRMELDASLLS